MFDIILRQGLILDGTAAPGKVADLGIVGDQITAIGDLSGESAKQEIDARGKVVTPGFIDPHSHSDLSVLFEPSMTNYPVSYTHLDVYKRQAPAFRGEPHDDFNDASGIECRGLSAESMEAGLAISDRPAAAGGTDGV